jgi:hypothetical protein
MPAENVKLIVDVTEDREKCTEGLCWKGFGFVRVTFEDWFEEKECFYMKD